MRIDGAFDTGRWLGLRGDFPTESGMTRDAWVDTVLTGMRVEHGAAQVDPLAAGIRAAIEHGIDSVDPDALATLQYWPAPVLATVIVAIEGVVAPPEETTDVVLVPDDADPESVRIRLLDAPGLGVGAELRYAVPTGDPDVPALVGVSMLFRGPVGAVRITAQPTVPALALALVEDLRGLAAGIAVVAEPGDVEWQRATLELAPVRPEAPELWSVGGGA